VTRMCAHDWSGIDGTLATMLKLSRTPSLFDAHIHSHTIAARCQCRSTCQL